jgi:transcriptional regulator with XRE-family HTH domain
MDGPDIGRNLELLRRSRMWTQGRLAEESGVSPTTVSGIEGGKTSRPHFGTLRKLAAALGVEPEALVSSGRSPETDKAGNRPVEAPLSLDWAMSAREEEFEREVEEASLESLGALSRLLDEEQDRLQRLYEESSQSTEQRRYIKRRIRNVAAQSGSVDASILFQQRSIETRGSAEEEEEDGAPP